MNEWKILVEKFVGVYVYRVQNVIPRCPTPRLHFFLSSHWPSLSFLSFMAFYIPSIQFFFGSSSCSLLFRHPLQCSFRQSSFCHSLNMAVPCKLVGKICLYLISNSMYILRWSDHQRHLSNTESILRSYASGSSVARLLIPPSQTVPLWGNHRSKSIPFTCNPVKMYCIILTFCWPCIIMYHNNVTNLIHFHDHFIVS
jgi:hypothetical protein